MFIDLDYCNNRSKINNKWSYHETCDSIMGAGPTKKFRKSKLPIPTGVLFREIDRMEILGFSIPARDTNRNGRNYADALGASRTVVISGVANPLFMDISFVTNPTDFNAFFGQPTLVSGVYNEPTT